MKKITKGQLLLACKNMKDPNFFKTVVLLVEHNKEGTMGFILNHPTSLTVAEVLANHFELPEDHELVYRGGPVETSALFVLHNSPYLDMTEKPVLPGVFIGSSNEIFEKVVLSSVNNNEEISYRVFLGCSGWGPGQLNSEINRGDWLVVPSNGKNIFEKDACELWDEEMEKHRSLGGILPHANLNPGLN